MRSRAVRLTLTLLAVGALAAAAYLFWDIEQRSSVAAAASREAEARLAGAAREAFALRAAQQAYVAAGQSERFWISKVTASMDALRETFAALRGSPLSGGTLASIEAASQALDQFEHTDHRAREYASADQKLLASDLIFSDGLEASGEIVTALDEARRAHAEADSNLRAAERREQMLIASGGGAAVLFAVLLLFPLPRQKDAVVDAAPAPLSIPDAVAEFEVKPAPRREPEFIPELQDVADVCSQLARLADTATLPALLQRTALALDAAGVVLWLSDPDETELAPVAAHGYAASVLAKMGTIPREATNATAAAFRTGLLQVVKADALSNGAIAAPLVNTSGCIGVMSAEVRHDGEKRPARLAIATIVAAQLATIVAPAARGDALPRSAEL